MEVDLRGLQRPPAARPDRQPGVDELRLEIWRLLAAVLLSASVLAACGVLESAVDPQPCWQDRDEFSFEGMDVEGILQADREANGMFIRLPDGREVDIGFPDGYRVIFGPGLASRVDDPRRLTIAEAGDRITLWGGYTQVGEEPAPGSQDRNGLIVCIINGQVVRDANGATVTR